MTEHTKLRERIAGLRQPEHRWRWTAFICIVIYLLISAVVLGLRADQGIVAVLVFCLALGGNKSRQFLIDWAPFILFWVAYDMMRGIPDGMRPLINVTFPYKLELIIFGPLLGNQIPNFYFQYFQVLHDGALGKILLDIVGAIFYVLHFIAHLTMGWIFWRVTKDRKMFYLFVYTITALSIMALVTFMVYPAAPPWYVYKYGLIQPSGAVEGSAAGLVNFDNLIGFKMLQLIWDNFNSNLFAAIPSLHGAHACAVAYFGMRKFRRLRPLWLIHPIGTWVSAVYLNEHYIIDLLIGLVYLIAAYYAVKLWLYPKLLKNYIEKTEFRVDS